MKTESELKSSNRYLQLLDNLSSGDFQTREDAIKELAKDPDKEKAVNFLIYYIREHPRWEVRIAAARALGEIGAQEAGRDLAALYTEAVQTHDPKVTSNLMWITHALNNLGWQMTYDGWQKRR